MNYKADIGTWKKGKIVRIDAVSSQEAFRLLALKYGADNVVQISETTSKRCVYDFCNEFKLYEERGRI